MRARRARSATALAALALAAAACAAPARQRYEERLEATPAPAAHGVQSRRLADVMQGLARLSDERMPRGLDLEAERAGRLHEIVEVARAIAASAERIPEAAGELRLDDRERREFLALAQTLRARALALAEQAPGLGPDALRARSAELDATCAGCHERFRPLR